MRRQTPESPGHAELLIVTSLPIRAPIKLVVEPSTCEESGAISWHFYAVYTEAKEMDGGSGGIGSGGGGLEEAQPLPSGCDGNRKRGGQALQSHTMPKPATLKVWAVVGTSSMCRPTVSSGRQEQTSARSRMPNAIRAMSDDERAL